MGIQLLTNYLGRKGKTFVLVCPFFLIALGTSYEHCFLKLTPPTHTHFIRTIIIHGIILNKRHSLLLKSFHWMDVTKQKMALLLSLHLMSS